MGKIDLLELQSRCKKDPNGYRDDFLLQLEHFKALQLVFFSQSSMSARQKNANGNNTNTNNTNADYENFADLTSFLAHVHRVYQKDMEQFPKHLCELIDEHCTRLDLNLRRRVVQAMILLRNKNSIDVNRALPIFFKLFRVPDKQLRQIVFKHVVNDAKQANKLKKNEQYNRVVRQFLRDAVKDENVVAAKKALAIVTELYRRNIWNDAKAVNLVVEACYHDHPKILCAGLKFFLGQDEAAEKAAAEGGDSESDDDQGDGKDVNNTKQGGKQLVSKDDVFKAYHKVFSLMFVMFVMFLCVFLVLERRRRTENMNERTRR
jgi:protein SDA1